MKSVNNGAPEGQEDAFGLKDADARNAQPQDDTAAMFAEGDGKREDGALWLSKITTEAIRAFPERIKMMDPPQPMKCCIFSGIATGTKMSEQVGTGEVFTGLVGEFGAVRFDNNGLPDGVFKSDTLYLPIGHDAALRALGRTGQLTFALEFTAIPASNPRGYSWSYRNLAKLDRDNLSPIDRLLIHSARASQALIGREKTAGILEYMRPSS